MISNGEFIDYCFVLQKFYSPEQALEKIKAFLPTTEKRTSADFIVNLMNSDLTKLNTQVKYAAMYRVFTNGSYNWTETELHHTGNALYGNFYFETESHKIKEQSLDLTIIPHGDEYFIDMESYKKDNRKILTKSNYEEISKLPLLYPLLSPDALMSNVKQRLGKGVKNGYYNISDLTVMLILVPVACFTLNVNDNEYNFYANLYNNDIDALDVDVSPVIASKFEKLSKFYKRTNIIKYGLIGWFALNLVLTILCAKGYTASTAYGTWFFFAAICIPFILCTRKRHAMIWDNISRKYEYDDKYIKDNGAYTLRTLVFCAVNVLQIVIPTLSLLLHLAIIFQ